MRTKERQARQRARADLARQDALNRCAWCKVALTERIVAAVPDRRQFCSEGCLEDQLCHDDVLAQARAALRQE